VELGLFVNPSDREDLIKKALEAGEVRDFEIRLRAKHGAIVIGRLSVQMTEIDGELHALAILIDITRNKYAEEQLLASREQLRALAGRLQAVREEERTKIAREIHDVLAQELTRMKIDLSWLSKRLSVGLIDLDPQAVRDRLDTLNQLADTTISTVQKIAAELRPVVLDSLGLSAAIEWQAEEFQARTGIHCEAVLPDEEFELDREAATGLFRIVQESLTNIVRHAQATQVDIVLELEDHNLRLDVQDNGVGFDETRMKDPHSLGLLGMRERALLLDGKFEIRGSPGAGTRVSVTMPMNGHGRIFERIKVSDERTVLL
jgi:signal transduction histidine kinase